LGFRKADDSYLCRRNSIHRFNLRQIEKNRFPVKCSCAVCRETFLCRSIGEYVRRQYYLGPDKAGNVRHVCWSCGLENKVSLAAGTLYHLIEAIPVWERDRHEIYPGDYRRASIPRPQRTNWAAGTLERWFREGWPHYGLPSAISPLGIRDYAEPTKLRTRYGRYEHAYRQKAASAGWHVVFLPAARRTDIVPVNDALWLSELLPSPQKQQLLKRVGRLYKNSCWFPQLGPRRPFDKYQSASWEAGYAAKEYTATAGVQKDADRDIELEREATMRVRRVLIQEAHHPTPTLLHWQRLEYFVNR
jgi:hypothetical protein